MRAASPTIVYASFSGYGTRGPDQSRPGFDYAAFWARSGLMGLLGEPPSPPPLCRGGQGDHTTALNILAAVLAALRLRDQTNEAQHCEVTLQGTGMWTLGATSRPRSSRASSRHGTSARGPRTRSGTRTAPATARGSCSSCRSRTRTGSGSAR
jgi:crotonobetainyl-CoA:carnitine CoA-transferase CaiB-like acyl-CoA transferase